MERSRKGIVRQRVYLGQNHSTDPETSDLGKWSGYFCSRISADRLCNESQYRSRNVSAASNQSTQSVSPDCTSDRSTFAALPYALLGKISVLLYKNFFGNENKAVGRIKLAVFLGIAVEKIN